MIRYVNPDGSLTQGKLPELSVAQMRELWRFMAIVRRVDTEATALARQGELAVWAGVAGQEAAQVGSAFALEQGDMAFPSYRESGVAIVRGVDPVGYVHFFRGTWHGGIYDPNKHGFAMISVPVASQTLHATGWAMGAKLEGDPHVAVAYFGDGATSEGDFHEACNFAAVFEAPVIFFCQNNGWAISVPVSQQTRVPIHQKAAAYGFPGVCVDGNDVLAVFEVTRRARADGLKGIPTLIEAMTYRLAAHSTADDNSIYQPADEIARRKLEEPLIRYRALLEREALVDSGFFASIDDEANEIAARLRHEITTAGAPPLRDLFDWVYTETPQHLVRQREEVLRGELAGWED